MAEGPCPVDRGADASDDEDDTTPVPEDGFDDVTDSNVHEFNIDCAAWYEITSGTSADSYTPAGNVRRDQMATFIAQLIDYVADRTDDTDDGLDAAPSGNLFPCDLTTSNTHFANIQRLAAADIVLGTSENSNNEACYDPDGLVTRGQMATFIANAQEVLATIDPLNTSVDYFVDDDGTTHEDNINLIASESIVRGTGTNDNNEALYSPSASVRRDSMASFLINKLDYLFEELAADNDNLTPPPFAEITAVATVAAGGMITGTVTAFNGNIDSLDISGCGVTSASTTVTVADPPDGTATFTAMVPLTQDTGNCVLTVVTNFTDKSGPNIFAGDDRSETDTGTCQGF